jgi:parallel beta-helix repeat protein
MRWQVHHGIACFTPVCAIVALALLLPGESGEDVEAKASPARARPAVASVRYVSPRGSDRGPGTASRPWRTLGRAIRAAGPGDTVVLRPGTYGRRGDANLFARDGSESMPITVRGVAAGRPPTILGSVKIAASHLRFWRLVFAGPTGRVKPAAPDNPGGQNVQIAIDADGRAIEDIKIQRCVVRDSHWHAGIYVANATGVRIVGNYIHDNGDPSDPKQANLSHGIYWNSGSGLIANNVIEDNLARGIQLYPAPTGITVIHNTVIGNGAAGVQLGAEASDNTVVNNVLAFNGSAGVRSASLSGSDNVARRNLVWANGAYRDHSPGLRVSESIEAPPRFSSGYRLSRRSPAVDQAAPAWTMPIDRFGTPRPRGASADLGAFESW